jgi:SprT-like family
MPSKKILAAREKFEAKGARRLKWLVRVYAEYNTRYWAGRLPPAYTWPQRQPAVVNGVFPMRFGGALLQDVAASFRAISGTGPSIYFHIGWLAVAKPDRLREILLHEMGHAVVVLLHGAFNDDHGPVWRAEMQQLYDHGEHWVVNDPVFKLTNKSVSAPSQKRAA